MQFKKSHESGSIMVEVIAVLALLGVMGMMMFRQIQRRNEELSNINMASEIRMIKEATTAYIQANKANLEANNCPDISSTYTDTTALPRADVEKFLPDNWISDVDTENGIIYEYQIDLSCYRINSAAADNRLGMYATIIPNDPSGSEASPIPPDFSYRRAARVATLIGSDGGVYERGFPHGHLVGTAGAWEIECEEGSPCDGRTDNFYVATTGMDIYIPETDKTADNTVAVPHNIAFENLHSTDYFSVGDGTTNCIGNYDSDTNQFAHETLPATPTGIGQATPDDIRRVGTSGCDPLFWVGTAAGGNDHSAVGHVYVKNNLYIGRDNTNNRQAIALETGNNNTDRAITVFDVDGQGRLTLNGAGQIIGRVDSTGKGYKLDAENGEIVLFNEVNATVDGAQHVVQIPTLRLKDGRMETNVNAQYYDNSGTLRTDAYAVDPAGESLMNDIRLTSRGGARLSDILPDYILKGTQVITRTGTGTTSVTKPVCPTGYAQAISITPTRYSQYVKGANLNLNLTTNSTTGTTSHTHNITGTVGTITTSINGNANGTTLRVNGTDGNVNGTSLTLTQLPPVSIAINSVSNNWTVGLTYGGQAPTVADPITALAQTYCVFKDTTNRNIIHTNANAAVTENGMRIEAKGAGVITNKVCTEATESTANAVCANTEKCVNGYCHSLGTCSEEDNTHLGGHIYCLKGVQVYLECFEETASADCGSGKVCTNNKCVTTGS